MDPRIHVSPRQRPQTGLEWSRSHWLKMILKPLLDQILRCPCRTSYSRRAMGGPVMLLTWRGVQGTTSPHQVHTMSGSAAWQEHNSKTYLRDVCPCRVNVFLLERKRNSTFCRCSLQKQSKNNHKISLNVGLT